MLLPITIEPNEILHKKAEKISIEKIKTPEFQNFIGDMIETMYKKDGVGLAGPQVGISEQICVIAKEYSTFENDEDLVLINPKWKKISRWKAWDEEGCLSVPLTTGKVKRYKKIKVEAIDRNGENVEFEAEGFFARIIQHETDHLRGVLFIEKAKNLRNVTLEE